MARDSAFASNRAARGDAQADGRRSARQEVSSQGFGASRQANDAREPAKEVAVEVLEPGWRPHERDANAGEAWREEGAEEIDLADLLQDDRDEGDEDDDAEENWLEWDSEADDYDSDKDEDLVSDEDEARVVDADEEDELDDYVDDDEDVGSDDVDGGLASVGNEGDGLDLFEDGEDDDMEYSDISDDDDDDIFGETFLLEMQAELQELKDDYALLETVSDITASEAGVDIDAEDQPRVRKNLMEPVASAATIAEEEAAGADDTDLESAIAVDSAAAADAAEADEADDAVEERSAILLELAGSTPATLERLLKKYSGMLDEDLLQMLYRRIEAAQEMNEGTDVVEGLVVLFKRIRAEVERKSSTPALRLLDELLGVMGSEAGESEQARVSMAAEVMQRAFSPTGAFGVDIFEVAGALGAGNLDAVDAQTVEYVDRGAFMQEVGQLVSAQALRLPARERQLEDMEVRIRAGVVKGLYTSAERGMLEDKLRVQREKYADTAQSLKWAELFLKLADVSEDS